MLVIKAKHHKNCYMNKYIAVLADSEEDPQTMENHRARPEIFKAYGGQTGRSIRFSRTLQTEMLYVGLPIRRGGMVTEVLRFSLYIRNIRSLIRSLRNRIVPIILAMLMLSLIIALIINRSLTKPVRELVRASRNIAAGDFSVKVRFKARNEVSDLAESFNFMTDRISSPSVPRDMLLPRMGN
jgi:two-component system phosphate regulon sensor histidine kinase PhoR